MPTPEGTFTRRILLGPQGGLEGGIVGVREFRVVVAHEAAAGVVVVVERGRDVVPPEVRQPALVLEDVEDFFLHLG